MARPDERKFVTFERGRVRDDIILARFRNVLRTQINPDTGVIFTEADIDLITQIDSRFFTESDGIDLYGQAIQQRAMWLADQVRPERAASEYLTKFHGPLWLPEGRLESVGGSGPVTATGSAGTIFVGSTELGDPTAHSARSPNGSKFQVLFTKSIPTSSQSTVLQFIGIDGGDVTNLSSGTELTWINPPIGSSPTCTVLTSFTGGFNRETEPEFSKRIVRRIRSKPGAGNHAQFRLWATSCSTAIEDAFVYPCAFHNGSIMVALLQKRGTTVGPFGQIASIGTLAIATAFLTPPSTPVVPHGVHVLVVTFIPEPTNLALRLAMPMGSSGGWTDVSPWPRYSITYPEGVRISALTSQVDFTVQTDEALSGAPLSGASAPSLSVWNNTLSEFEHLDVQSVSHVGGDNWRIQLNNPPSKNILVNDVISPKNERSDIITEVIEDYFDGLGPGEIVEQDDLRYVVAARYPRPDQEYNVRAGQGIIARLDDQLGGALSDAELSYISIRVPTIPSSQTDLINGPNKLTLNHVGVYAFN